MRFIAALLVLLAIAAPTAAQPGEPFPDTRLFREARTFMADYAEDLRRGNRAGIAARYDREGAWVVGDGASRFETHAQIIAAYADTRWQPPARFEWRDLSYLMVGPDRVLVVGLFLWTPAADAAPLTFSYTALLQRQDGPLRIRMEHESTGAGRGS